MRITGDAFYLRIFEIEVRLGSKTVTAYLSYFRQSLFVFSLAFIMMVTKESGI